MVVVEVSIIAGAVLAGGAAVLHFYDRFFDNGFYQRTTRLATANAKAIHTSLEGLKLVLTAPNDADDDSPFRTLQNALAGLPGLIEAGVANGIVAASTRVMEEQTKAMRGFTPEQTGVVQSMGADAASAKALTKSLKAAVGADMIGPYAGILAEWAPTVFAWLQEHPDSVQWALSQPWLQGLIKKAQEAFNERSGSIRGGESPVGGGIGFGI